MKENLLTVIMPAYNEQGTIYGTLTRVLKQKAVSRVIIVDDGSDDKTVQQAERAAARAPSKVKIIRSKNNMGKGHALRTALDNVSDDALVIVQDADTEYYPEDYTKLLKAFDGVNPVFGYRAYHTGHQYKLALAANILHTSLFNLLYGQHIRDVNVCYKLFTKSMLKHKRLRQNGFAIEEEIAILLSKNGYDIKDVPIRYKGRTFEEGKKIGVHAAIGNVLFMISSRFN